MTLPSRLSAGGAVRMHTAARISSRNSDDTPSTQHCPGNRAETRTGSMYSVLTRTAPTMRVQCSTPGGIHNPRLPGTNQWPSALPTTNTP